MPTVFITQIPSRIEAGRWVPTVDINPAKEFGEIKIISPAGMNIHAAEAGTVASFLELCDLFNPSQDYFLPMGDPLLMVSAAAALAQRHKKFHVLKWDRYLHKYFQYTVDTNPYRKDLQS